MDKLGMGIRLENLKKRFDELLLTLGSLKPQSGIVLAVNELVAL